MGVWIEIARKDAMSGIDAVTPCVGVWIEMHVFSCKTPPFAVTPCVGVWIEILRKSILAR